MVDGQKRFLPRTAGHNEGLKRVTEIVEVATKIGINTYHYTLFYRELEKASGGNWQSYETFSPLHKDWIK